MIRGVFAEPIAPNESRTAAVNQSPMAAAIIDEVASEQDDIGILLRATVVINEVLVPVVVGGGLASPLQSLPEIFFIHIGTYIHVGIGDVADLQRRILATLDEERVKHFGARSAHAELGVVRGMQRTVLVFIFFEQIRAELLPELAELLAPRPRKLLDQERHFIGRRFLGRGLIVPEKMIEPILQPGRSFFADTDLVQIRDLLVSVEFPHTVREVDGHSIRAILVRAESDEFTVASLFIFLTASGRRQGELDGALVIANCKLLFPKRTGAVCGNMTAATLAPWDVAEIARGLFFRKKWLA